jgi:hypothetical protein
MDEFYQELIGAVSDLADTLASIDRSIEPLSQDETAVRIFILQYVYSVLINEQNDPPAGAGSNRGLYSHAIPPVGVHADLDYRSGLFRQQQQQISPVTESAMKATFII